MRMYKFMYAMFVVAFDPFVHSLFEDGYQSLLGTHSK